MHREEKLNETVSEFIIIGLSNLGQYRFFFFFSLLIIFTIIITGNVLILLIILRNRHLHTPMYFCIGTLSFLEICCTVLTVPGMLVISWLGRTSISTTGCFLQMYLIHSLGIAENYLLTIMAYDRYVAICKPLLYNVIMTPKFCKTLICSCCLLGFFWPLSLLSLVYLLPFCDSNRIYHLFCDSSPLLHLACANISIIHFVDTAIGLGMIILTSSYILLIYIMILYTIMKMQESKEQKRAISMCISHFAVVLIFYASVIFMYIILHGDYAHEFEEAVAVNYCILTPLFNPIIYGVRNKEIKKSLVMFLQECKQNSFNFHFTSNK